MTKIHESSVVSSEAVLGNDVVIGPYCTISDKVILKDGVELVSHVSLAGDTIIGNNCKIFPFASVGHEPQDLKFKGENSKLIIGNNNIIREHVTINPGTTGGGMITTIGNNCLFMVGSHVAHDCIIGNHVILVNNASLAGHVKVDDFAILGAFSGVHQFCRIGRYSMIGGFSAVVSDIIPFATAVGNRAHLSSLNIIGLKRKNFSKDVIQDLRKAYGMLFGAQDLTFSERINEVKEDFSSIEPIMEIVDFILEKSSRSICKPKNAS